MAFEHILHQVPKVLDGPDEPVQLEDHDDVKLMPCAAVDYGLDSGPVQILGRVPAVPDHMGQLPLLGQAVGADLLLLGIKGHAPKAWSSVLTRT